MSTRVAYYDIIKKLWTDSNGTALQREQDKPRTWFRDKFDFELHLLEDGAQYTGLTDITSFTFAVDNDWTHKFDGILTEARSGAVTDIKASGFTEDPPESGNVVLKNAAGDSEVVAYSAWVESGGEYTFTVSATLTYSYIIGDQCDAKDALLIKTDNSGIDSSQQATGILTITIDAETIKYEEEVEGISQINNCIFEVQGYNVSSEKAFSTQGEFFCMNILDDETGIAPPSQPVDFYTKSQGDARYQEKDSGDVAGNVAIMDGLGDSEDSGTSLSSIVGGMNYQGTWNATTNTPTLTSSVGTKGHFYQVSVAGSTNLDGITDWQVSDYAVFSGTVWQKVDNTEQVGGNVGSTDNALVRANGTGGGTVQGSTAVIEDNGKLDLPDDAVEGRFKLVARSAEPTTPIANDIYLDDGTNTASGVPGWRQWNGATWDDIGAVAGSTLPVVDTTSIVKDPGDNTKQMRVDVGNVATATIRQLEMPNADVLLRKNNMTGAVAPTVNDDDTSFYDTNSIWLDLTADKAYVCLDPTTGAAVWKEITAGLAPPFDDATAIIRDTGDVTALVRMDAGNVAAATTRLLEMPDADVLLRKNNYGAAVAPVVGDDNTAGYAINSLWLDTTADKAYICLDASTGAAVWVEITAGAAGGEANTASNYGVGGIGVFNDKNGVDLRFRNINDAGNGRVLVTLDGPNREVLLDLDMGVVRRDINNDQSGTSYTLVLTDAGKTIWMSNAAANTMNIPTNASVAFPVGTTLLVLMEGAGTTTVQAAGGVTLNGVTAGGATINGQYQVVSLVKRGTDAWVMFGAHGTVA